MPLHREYRALIDSDLADMKNTGGRFGGAITAAFLLSEFVGDPARDIIVWGGFDRCDEHYQRKGASGFGVRTLVALCESLADRKVSAAFGVAHQAAPVPVHHASPGRGVGVWRISLL